MRTHVISTGIRRRRLLFLFLAIGLSLTINSARAESAAGQIPLAIKGVDGKVEAKLPVWIKVENLEKWAEEPGNDTSKFTLCLNGNELRGIHPTFQKEDLLGFQLSPTSESRDAWRTLVSQRLKEGDKQVVFVTLRHDKVKVQGYAKAAMAVIDWFWLKIFLAIVLAALILFAWVSYKSDIIREAGGQPEDAAKRKRYSLARTQMAAWFFVVLFSYVFIWMLTDDLTNLPASVLALIGISAATGLSSAVVDSTKRNEKEVQLRTLEEKEKNDELEAAKLRSEINAGAKVLKAAPAPTNADKLQESLTARQMDLAAKMKEIEQLKGNIMKIQDKLMPVPSGGFFDDLLADDGGLSFHRFQMLAWTIVLIVIFTIKVYDGLAMPDFDTTLLALMGISGGAYIGFKMPKQEG